LFAPREAARLVFIAHPGQVVAQILRLDFTYIHVAHMLQQLFELLLVAFERAVAQSLGGFVLDEAGQGLRKLKDWRSSVHFGILLGARSPELTIAKPTKTP